MALCAVVVSGVVHAQDDTLKRWRTCDFNNGRFWTENKTFREAYLVGLLDTNWHYTQVLNVALDLKPPNLWQGIWPKGATIGEVKEGLNQFYQDPANLQISIISAIAVIKQRFEGKDPQAIEKDIRTDRQWAVSCQQDEK
jgi:hypothetical protein